MQRHTLTDSVIARRIAQANQRISPPADLVNRIEQARGTQRTRVLRRRGGWTGALAAAAAIIVAVLGWVMSRPQITPPATAPPSVVKAESPAAPAPPPEILVQAGPASQGSPGPVTVPSDARPAAEVRFAADSEVFGRELASRNPNVTIVMLYRSVRSDVVEHENGGS